MKIKETQNDLLYYLIDNFQVKLIPFLHATGGGLKPEVELERGPLRPLCTTQRILA